MLSYFIHYLGEMRGEEKPYDMQAPCNDTELTKAIENDREIEETAASSLLTTPPTLELPNLSTTLASAVTSLSAVSTSIQSNDISSIMAASTKSFNVTLPDSPIVSFPNICSLLNGDEIDIKDHINEPNNISPCNTTTSSNPMKIICIREENHA